MNNQDIILAHLEAVQMTVAVFSDPEAVVDHKAMLRILNDLLDDPKLVAAQVAVRAEQGKIVLVLGEPAGHLSVVPSAG